MGMKLRKAWRRRWRKVLPSSRVKFRYCLISPRDIRAALQRCVMRPDIKEAFCTGFLLVKL